MVLEPDKKDRSYQFGRLLAVLEKRNGIPMAAMRAGSRMQPPAVCFLPASPLCRPYYRKPGTGVFPRLPTGSRMFYKSSSARSWSGSVGSLKSSGTSPPAETYLMGYYLQRMALYAPKNNDAMEEKKK